MLDPDRWHEVTRLEAADFYRPGHRVIFEAMAFLAAHGQPLDIVTLNDRLVGTGMAEKAGGPAYLAELCEATPGSANVGAYAAIIQRRADLRHAITAAGDVYNAAMDLDEDGLAEARARFDALRGGLSRYDLGTYYSDLPPLTPTPWVVDGLLYREGVYAFVGAPKSGKSQAAATLAAALCSPESADFLDRDIVLRGNAVVVDYENPSHVTRKRFDLLHGGGLSLEGLVLLLNQPSPESTAAGAAHLRAVLAEHAPIVLIVDGLQGWARIENLNDYAQVHAAVVTLRTLAAEFRTVVVFQHHGSKHSNTDPSGSNAIAGNVDGIVGFTRAEEGADAEHSVFTRDLRDGNHIPKSIVELDPGGRSIIVESVSKRRRSEASKQRQQAILDWLEDNGPTSPSRLAREVKGRNTEVYKDCDHLAREGRITLSGTKGKKGPDGLRYAIREG